MLQVGFLGGRTKHEIIEVQLSRERAFELEWGEHRHRPAGIQLDAGHRILPDTLPASDLGRVSNLSKVLHVTVMTAEHPESGFRIWPVCIKAQDRCIITTS